MSSPRRAAVALVVVGALAAIALLLFNRQPAPSVSSIGGPFTLSASDGCTVTDADFRGRYMLVYFGYTHCPDVCPTALTTISNALDQLGPEASRVQPIFITVDPARDTPAALAQYDAAFTKSLVGLTGTPEQIAHVAREYRVYYAVHREAGDGDDYSVDHSSVLYLMGPDGHLTALLDASEDADHLARDLRDHIDRAVAGG